MSYYDNNNFPIGVDEVSRILGVKPATVSTWYGRKNMPQPDAYINRGRTRLWAVKTIIDWANATGRNPMDITNEQAVSIVMSKSPESAPTLRHKRLKEQYERYLKEQGKTTDEWDNWDFGNYDK